jgi:hypothetical protein
VNTVTNGRRVGTIMAVWDSGFTSFTDYSSPDLVGSTVDFKWSVISSAGQVMLESNVGDNTWNAKVSVRIIS